MTTPMMIISTALPDLDKTVNAKRTSKLLERLLDTVPYLPIIPCSGVYQGIEEDGFCIYLPKGVGEGFIPTMHIFDIATEFNQESILVVDTEGKAKILNKEYDRLLEGPWTALPDGVPPDTDDYTEILGIKYQIGRRLDYPELEGVEFKYSSEYNEYTLKVLGCNFDIGFTAYDIEGDPSVADDQVVCCVGPQGPGWNNYDGAFEEHIEFFDYCVAAVQAGLYEPHGDGAWSIQCPFSA